jgi:hypothetical protein
MGCSPHPLFSCPNTKSTHWNRISQLVREWKRTVTNGQKKQAFAEFRHLKIVAVRIQVAFDLVGSAGWEARTGRLAIGLNPRKKGRNPASQETAGKVTQTYLFFCSCPARHSRAAWQGKKPWFSGL